MKTGKELWNQKFADSKRGYYSTGGPDRRQRRADFRRGRRRVHHARVPGRLGSGHREEIVAQIHHSRARRARFRDLAEELATPGRRAEVRPGAPAPTIRNSIWCIGEPAMRSRTIPGRARVWIACSPTACSRSGRRRVRWLVIFNTRPTMSTTWTPPTSRCSPISGLDGQLRKVMIQTNKNGFLYVLDRTNCKLIAAHPYVKVNWATQIDMATGRPVLTDVQKRFLAGEEVEIWPSRGTNAVPIAFDPNTGLIYASTWNVPRIQKLAPPKPAAMGKDSTGVDRQAAGNQAGGRRRSFCGDQSTDRREEMGGSIDRSAQLGRHAGDRRRACVHRQIDGRVPRARREYRQNALAVQDRIERQFDGDHLHAQRPPICDHRVGTRRRVWPRRYAASKVPAGGSVWTFALMPE